MASETNTRREWQLDPKDESDIRLSTEDQFRVAMAILESTPPGAALRRAKRRHALHVEVN